MLFIFFVLRVVFFLKKKNLIFYSSLFFVTLFSTYFYFLLIDSFNCIQNSYFLTNNFSLDSASLLFIFLVFIIFPICIIYNYKVIYFSFNFYIYLLILIFLLLILAFTSNDFFFFYIFFESLLIPMSLVISLWGSRGRKLHASFLFFFYTFISSVFLLFAMLLLFLNVGLVSFCLIKLTLFNSLRLQIVVLICFFIGFMAKIPCFPIHIWLPEAHVEAPTVGSVILASILLKLGYYGLFRTIFYISSSECLLILKPFYSLIFLISMIYSGFNAICQIDLKRIVAYSSVVHMNFAMLGFINFTYGVNGSFFLMFSHGLISAALFFSVGFLYDRFFTRNVIYYGGLVQFMPLFSIFYFTFIFSNMSLPGTCNFIGELLVFFSLINYSFTLMTCALISIFFTSVFCLILLNRILFGQISGFLNFNLSDLTLLEFFVVLPLFLFIYLFGLLPNLIMGIIVLVKV